MKEGVEGEEGPGDSGELSASVFLLTGNPSGGLEFCRSARSSFGLPPSLKLPDRRLPLVLSAHTWPGSVFFLPASVMCFIHLARSFMVLATSS